MSRPVAVTSAYAGGLLAVVGAIAWATGTVFVFPKLGPTAYLLATVRRGGAAEPRRVVLGHAVGVLAGLAAHGVVTPELVVTAASPAFDTELLRLAIAGALSVAATTAGMHVGDAVHPPACATTLIVSLGLLPSLVDGGVIVASVVALLAVHLAVDEYLCPSPPARARGAD